MDLQKQKNLARKITGREIPVVSEPSGKTETNGSVIWVSDPDADFPDLSKEARNEIGTVMTAHEASHIVLFDRVAKKIGRPSVSSDEFYQIFADPACPDAGSKNYVRFIMNVVEDRLCDEHAARYVDPAAQERVYRFFVWRRQGGTRPSLAELEAGGNPGKCAAFLEAVFQLETYNELIESFFTPELETAAREAVQAITAYGQGSLSRQQALGAVLKALSKYCRPPPWTFPPKYQPPRGEGTGAGNGQDQPGQSGQSGKGDQSGKSGKDGKGEDGEGGGDSADADGSGEADGNESGKSGKESKGKGKEGKEGKSGEGESESAGDGAPSESQSRGTETGDEAGTPRQVESVPEKRFEDNNLEALLKMLERVLAERAHQQGRGIPRWREWSPGEPVKDPDAIHRYEEDESFGIDPLKRRVVHQRDPQRHLLAVFIDSSGSVSNQLFSQLHRVFAELAEKVADLDGCELGVGQFSGGACWVMEPTRDIAVIRALAEEAPKRLFSGGTTVGEIYGLLPEWFSGYRTADLVVLTDGYVEDGRALARSLGLAHQATSCEIKLHGVVFERMGTLKQFVKAKDELPQFVRTWHLGGEGGGPHG